MFEVRRKERRMREQMPKTKECCGVKPKRCGIQLGYKDEINKFVIECRKKCGNRIVENDDSCGDYQIELSAVKKWNELLTL